MTVGDLSPTLLDRYIAAAQKISRLAVGSPGRSPGGDTFRIRADLTQEEHVEGLPLGTRGGALIRYTFPQDGEYDVQLRLTRDRNEHVEGLREPHELEVLLDRERMASFTVMPPRTEREHQTVDEGLKARIRVTAGPHQVGVTFLKGPSSLLETKRSRTRPTSTCTGTPASRRRSIRSRSPGRITPEGTGTRPAAVGSSSIGRRGRVTRTRAPGASSPRSCAGPTGGRWPTRTSGSRWSSTGRARAEGGFDAGIEMALSAVLVNPQFLFRVEQDPPGVAPGTAYRIGDLPLASRLSFFLWSSIPDDELLDLASRGELGEPEVLERQVRRMLADPRSRSLVTNFADQWLHLRNLESTTPDLRLFPDFDDNLRQAFRRETELLFEGVLREDRSVLDLLKSDHTFLNERLARHYGIPHVYGSRFRRVPVGDDSVRGGLFRHGSILTVTSYATRTSPVIRGKWVLENILGTPPPPPPADVPALKDNTVSSTLSVRERLAEHRRDVACAGCHKLDGPRGLLARELRRGRPVAGLRRRQAHRRDGGAPRRQQVRGGDRPRAGPAEAPGAVRRHPDGEAPDVRPRPGRRALRRPGGPQDRPRRPREDYRFSSLILGIATSTPFQMRKSE